jgi:hypothetical protein
LSCAVENSYGYRYCRYVIYLTNGCCFTHSNRRILQRKGRIRKTRGSYRRFTAHQIEQLFDYVIEQGKTAKKPALLIRINIRTAQHYVK